MKEMLLMAIIKAHRKKKKIGLCGQAPGDFPEMTQFLVDEETDCISFNPDAVAAGIENIVKDEKAINKNSAQKKK